MNRLFVIFACVGILISGFSGCSQEEVYKFQSHDNRSFKLWEIFDETPAIKSMFSTLDPGEFNDKLDELISSDPALMVDVLRALSETAYGDDPAFPQAIEDLAESLTTFNNVYTDKEDELNSTIDVVENVLDIDPAVMTGGVDSITDLLKALQNTDQTYSWDLFSPGQEFDDVGTNGIARLIDSLDFVHELYDGESMTNTTEFVQNFLQAIQDDNVDVEARITEIIEYLEKPGTEFDSVEATEKEVADWMGGDSNKVAITNFLMGEFDTEVADYIGIYPMIKSPVLSAAVLPDNFDNLQLPSYITTEDDYKNFIKRGRWLLDATTQLLSASPKSLSAKYDTLAPSTDDTHILKSFFSSLNNDMVYYDDFETLKLFDYDNNELLKW
ncbi:MAG: hypothetical protein GY754_38060, partial [bacterium]|nr:hypothetical protein [bacterium]